MDKNIAYCVIDCSKCELYIATSNEDRRLKEDISIKWGKLYNKSFKIEEIECKGCRTEKKFFLCDRCNIPTCNMERGTEKCSDCNKYPCERISKFYEWQKKNDTKAIIEK